MSHRIHDEEPDIGESVARALLGFRPDWAAGELEYLATSGTDNAMWRVRAGDDDLVLRLPRRPGAAAGAVREFDRCEDLAEHELAPGVITPRPRQAGQSPAHFPHPWAIYDWIEGRDAWSARDALTPGFVDDVATVVGSIGRLVGVSAPSRPAGARGGPLGPLLDRALGWLDDPSWRAEARLDVEAVRRHVDAARELVDEPVAASFVHGDLIPGNLLVVDGRLRAVIDWGGAGIGDAAQDLAPAWALFDTDERRRFRDLLDVDEVTWRRARVIELEHAVGGVLYYEPRGHVLGDIMRRTLERILAEPA